MSGTCHSGFLDWNWLAGECALSETTSSQLEVMAYASQAVRTNLAIFSLKAHNGRATVFEEFSFQGPQSLLLPCATVAACSKRCHSCSFSACSLFFHPSAVVSISLPCSVQGSSGWSKNSASNRHAGTFTTQIRGLPWYPNFVAMLCHVFQWPVVRSCPSRALRSLGSASQFGIRGSISDNFTTFDFHPPLFGCGAAEWCQCSQHLGVHTRVAD